MIVFDPILSIQIIQYSSLQQQMSVEDEMPQELCELAKNLSMELAIPLLGSPIDIDFATQCVNTILCGLNPNWKKISFQIQSDTELQAAWSKLFKIVESAFLVEGEILLEDNEQIGVQNITMLYQILSQGCQALRQQSMKPMASEKKNRSGPKSKNKEGSYGEKKNPQKNKQIKNKAQNKSKQQQAKKVRPKTSSINRQNNELTKNLEKQIIEQVTKTMGKKYLKKAEPQRQARIRQKQGTQAVQKAKRTLQYAIKDYEITNRLNAMKKQKAKGNGGKKDLADEAYMKMIENKHKQLNHEVENQQLKYYLELRDKKVAYIQHIHKLIEKLEKQRQLDFNKQQRQVQHTKKKELVKKIDQVDNLFRTNMEQLQENYQKRKKVQNLQHVGQMEVCRAMEKSMKQKKFKQMQDMRNVWEQERNQLHKITTDEQKMKNKLIDIYRKYRV